MPENFLENNNQSILCFDAYCDTILANRAIPFPARIRVFFGGKTKRTPCFLSFHPLADKTNNEHLPKPFFKVV